MVLADIQELMSWMCDRSTMGESAWLNCMEMVMTRAGCAMLSGFHEVSNLKARICSLVATLPLDPPCEVDHVLGLSCRSTQTAAY